MARLFVASNGDYIAVPTVRWGTVLSMSAWIKLASQPPGGSPYTIISTANFTGYTGFRFAYQNAGGIYYLTFLYTFYYPGGETEYHYAITLQTNTWYHIVWTFETQGAPDTTRLYIDGVEQTPVVLGSGSGDDPPNVFGMGETRIGSWFFAGNELWFFDGCIKEPAILAESEIAIPPVLSPLEVLQLFQGVPFTSLRPTSPANASHYQGAWPLDGTSDPEQDLSGRDRDSTLINGTSFCSELAEGCGYCIPVDRLARTNGRC